MVKVLFSFLLLCSFSYAQNLSFNSLDTKVEVALDPLLVKIKTFLDEDTYTNNSEFINVIFDPKSDFYKNGRVDVVKVVQTLKENGLLKLYFDKPKELHLNFKTSGSPLFFVKIMGDTLRNIGYYRYVTTASHLDPTEFTWNISLRSEYATDPLVLEEELLKCGCHVIDIQRESKTEWTYIVDISNAYLHVRVLKSQEKRILKRSLYAHWLNVSQIKRLKIDSARGNRWHPYISYYDESLHLLKVLKKNKTYFTIQLKIPENAKYIKVSDLYTLKNIRNELTLFPSGAR